MIVSYKLKHIIIMNNISYYAEIVKNVIKCLALFFILSQGVCTIQDFD